jgi:hypothetical protein
MPQFHGQGVTSDQATTKSCEEAVAICGHIKDLELFSSNHPHIGPVSDTTSSKDKATYIMQLQETQCKRIRRT